MFRCSAPCVCSFVLLFVLRLFYCPEPLARGSSLKRNCFVLFLKDTVKTINCVFVKLNAISILTGFVCFNRRLRCPIYFASQTGFSWQCKVWILQSVLISLSTLDRPSPERRLLSGFAVSRRVGT